MLSLSKHEAAARPVDASSFDGLRMRRMRAVRPRLPYHRPLGATRSFTSMCSPEPP